MKLISEFDPALAPSTPLLQPCVNFNHSQHHSSLTPQATKLPRIHQYSSPPPKMAKENLLIIGSTGWIGTYITREIINAKEHFNRIAIFTSASTLEKKAALFEGFKKEGVEIIVGDVSKEDDIKGALDGSPLPFQSNYRLQ
jgi:hypothetical protein